jgi:hypothetical protein
MRSWQRAPRVGTEISTISLNYFFSTALFFLALMSSFYWSAFPFDNLCPTEDVANSTVVGTYRIEAEEHGIENYDNVTVSENDPVWRFCNQDFILRPSSSEFLFPFIYREDNNGRVVEGFGEWMSEEQQFLSNLFGWTSVAFIALVSLKFVYGIFDRVKLEFKSGYKVSVSFCVFASFILRFFNILNRL